MRNKKFFLSALLASMLLGSQASYALNSDAGAKAMLQKEQLKPYMEHEAIVSFNEGVAPLTMVKAMQKLFGGSLKHHEYSLVNAMHIVVPSKSYEEIKTMILSNPMLKTKVKTVEPNGINSIESDESADNSLMPNDAQLQKDWYIDNRGGLVKGKKAKANADIDLKEAWQITKGSKDVVVAVLDGGVDYTHPDLQENMWEGSAHHGFDFAADNNGKNDDDPMPNKPYAQGGHKHGTHVAGTIGAVGDNGIGISGVAQHVQIMALKIGRPNGAMVNSDILEALEYVSKQIDKGVNVVAINASVGGFRAEDALYKAISNLGKKGVIFCAAAGNKSEDLGKTPHFPSSYIAKNIITVAATDYQDNLTKFSSYSARKVDIAAPGLDIYSAIPKAAEGETGGYAYLSGTSMATPIVTGTVALLASAYPETTVEQRIAAIRMGVDRLESLEDKVITSGRLNAYKALKMLSPDGPVRANVAPVAKDDKVQAQIGKVAVIDVLANDSDSDGDALHLQDFTKPHYGMVRIKDNKIEYLMPEKIAHKGIDKFRYVVNDGHGYEGIGTVIVNVGDDNTTKPPVNHAPIAKDDFMATEFETPITIDALANDSDKDGDVFKIELHGLPKHGSVELKDSKFIYTPQKGFSGKDEFAYGIADSKWDPDKDKLSEATVYVKVKANPNSPKDNNNSNGGDVQDGEHNTPKPPVDNNGTNGGEHNIDKGDYNTTKPPVDSGKKGSENNATKSPINHTPIATKDFMETKFEMPVTIDVLANDSDSDGDSLSIDSVTSPKHGKAVIKDGKILYTPQKGYSGSDRFEYTIVDNKGAKTEGSITVMVKVNKENAQDNSIPIVHNGDVEGFVKFFTNFTKINKDDHTEYQMDDSKGSVNVYKDGKIEFINVKALLPQSKLEKVSRVEVIKESISVKLKTTKDLLF